MSLVESDFFLQLEKDLAEYCYSIGFVCFGVSSPILDKRYTDRYQLWLSQDYHADMQYMQRHLEKKLNPRFLLDDVKSVIVLATPYENRSDLSSKARIARYAQGDDYHLVLSQKMKQIEVFLKTKISSAECYSSVDAQPVLERAYAEQAGIGWIGKNGNLINRFYGSYLFLSTLFTNLPFQKRTPHRDYCGSCQACIKNCPTQAIVAPGLVDSRVCIAYLNIEHRGEFLEHMPVLKLNNWLFGCDICQEVCPWNRFSKSPKIFDFCRRDNLPSTPEDWLVLSEESWAFHLHKSALKRAKRAGIERNARHLVKNLINDTR